MEEENWVEVSHPARCESVICELKLLQQGSRHKLLINCSLHKWQAISALLVTVNYTFVCYQFWTVLGSEGPYRSFANQFCDF